MIVISVALILDLSGRAQEILEHEPDQKAGESMSRVNWRSLSSIVLRFCYFGSHCGADSRPHEPLFLTLDNLLGMTQFGASWRFWEWSDAGHFGGGAGMISPGVWLSFTGVIQAIGAG